MTNPPDPCRVMAEELWNNTSDDGDIGEMYRAIRNHTAVPEMLESLKCFARLLQPYHNNMRDSDPFFQFNSVLITIGDLRRANAILKKLGVKV